MALVSVVVPVYGTEKYLRDCLDSILGQTLKDIEVIVVDDGSPDNSPKIIDEYASKDSRIIPIHKANAGVSEARNDGIAAASSEYCFLCDSDDWMVDNALENLYNTAKQTNADVVISDHFSHKDGEIFYIKAFPGRSAFVTSSAEEIELIQSACMLYGKIKDERLSIQEMGGIGAPWQHLYKREIIQKHSLRYNPALKGIFDDIMFNLEYYQVVKSVAYCDTPTYNYRMFSGSLTKSYKPNLIKIYQEAFRRVNDFLVSNNKGDCFIQTYGIRSIIYLDRMMSFYFLNKNNPNPTKARTEFLELMNQSPYNDVIKKCDYRKVGVRKIKIIEFLIKNNMAWVYWLVRTKNKMIIE